jgi:hypothetical protein
LAVEVVAVEALVKNMTVETVVLEEELHILLDQILEIKLLDKVMMEEQQDLGEAIHTELEVVEVELEEFHKVHQPIVLEELD